jgi:putative membrane protein
MYQSALMAFLHHLAAFTLVGALAAEVVLFRPPLSIQQAIRVQRADLIFGIAATVLLIVGLLRVLYFEKGAGYYFSNRFFLTKLALFIIASLISIYPTMLFLSWKKTVKQGVAPAIALEQVRRVRLCLMFELTAIVGIILCAPFMARGIGCCLNWLKSPPAISADITP